jgi:hypothetical protein
MFIRSLSPIVFLFAIIALLNFSSCDKKETGDTGQSNTKPSGQSSELIKQDDKGTKVSLILKPKKGEVFRYKINAKTTSSEKSPLTGDKEMNSEQDINYFYTEEVNDISSAGIITYKIKFDSINIVSTVKSADSSVSIKYNSNVKDSVYSKPDFLQYNAIMNEEFFARVSQQGEVSEIYGLEAVYDKIFKGLGDTLTAEMKDELKNSFGKEAITAVLQQQFQMFPQNEVYKDSTWTRSYETRILIFPVKNVLTYKISDIKEEAGKTLLTIDADLAVEFIEKEFKEKGMTYKAEEISTGGKGKIIYDITRGCVARKETSTNIDLGLRLSARGQSIMTKQKVKTQLDVQQL